MTKCQESDTLSDYESNLRIMLAQRIFIHLELQVIISLLCLGIITARCIMIRCAHIEVTVSLVRATKGLSQSTEKGLLDSKTVG